MIKDYGLNNIIILIRYLIPLINELQDRLAAVKYFTKINLKLGFYFVRMAKGKKLENRLPLPIRPFQIPGCAHKSY